MNNTYRGFMEKQSLSMQAKESIYDALQTRKEARNRPAIWRAAAVAALVLLMIPVTVYAAKNFFGISVVKIIEGNTLTGKPGTGYEVNYPDLYSHELAEFPEEIQTMEDYRLVVYESWQDAEGELGIPLAKNPILLSEQASKEHSFRLEEKRIFKRAHCYATYNALDGQFYRATLHAAYRYNNMHITLSSTVTCEHPAITQEEAYHMHYHGVMYRDHEVDSILQEQYLAENGIQATLVTVDRAGGKATDYEATFSAGGASYRITVRSYDKSRDAETKETLLNILEGFVF